MGEPVIDVDYENTVEEDEADVLAVDASWAEGGENVPAETVWAELGLLNPVDVAYRADPYRRSA